MTLHLSGIQDIVNSTLKELGRGRIQQVAQSLVGYPTCDYFFRREGDGRMVLDDGYEVQRSVWIKTQNVASSGGLWEADPVLNVENLTATASAPWRYYKAYWAMDQREVDVNSGPSRIFEMIKVRRNNAWLKLIEKLDNHLWTLPSASATTDLYGIPYAVVKNSSTGFNGGHPSGYSDVYNISRTTYTNWKNYTATYTTVTKSDLITTMRTGYRAMRFQDIEGLSLQDYRKGRDRYVNFVNTDTMAGFENVGEAQNENLGRDVAPFEGAKDVYRFEGSLTFRRKPIVYVPQLDTDTDDPVYSLDLSTWCMYVRRAFNMKQTGPVEVADNHNAFSYWYDLACQLMCVDPRRNGVFYIN